MAPDPLDFIRDALQWEERKQKSRSVLVPNVVDTGSAASIAIASELWTLLGVPAGAASSKVDAGGLLERGVAAYLRAALAPLDSRPWVVSCPGLEMTSFGQYSYFAKVRAIIKEDPVLAAAIGTDYLIKPDITVHLPRRFSSSGRKGQHPDPDAPLLHASVSCKWSLRSDRAQNVRPEAAALIDHRCGRVPHVVVVTAEPTIGRISSIAKGTGELDSVFHVALDALEEAMTTTGHPGQAQQLRNLANQGRLLDLRHLPAVLAEW